MAQTVTVFEELGIIEVVYEILRVADGVGAASWIGLTGVAFSASTLVAAGAAVQANTPECASGKEVAAHTICGAIVQCTSAEAGAVSPGHAKACVQAE